jgi:16S rRNA C967 or C1407 C5-methylase (RsmB/RsmF family)
MQELDLSEKILADILDNDVQFSEALKKVFQSDASIRSERSLVAGLVGCELRHHLLFAYLTEPLTGYEVADKRVLALALGDLYFFKRVPTDQILSALKSKLGDDKMALAQPLIDKAPDPESYIPSDLAKSSNKYLSLRYNTPEWVLKIWEHYGYGTTYKVLKKNNRPFVNSVRVRANMITPEQLMNNNPDYAKSPVANMLFYGGKTPLRKLPEYLAEQVFLEKLATKKIFDEYKVEEPSEVFLFNGNADSSTLKELIETYGSSIGLNLGVYDLQKYADVSKMIRSLGLKNVNFFAGDPSALEAAISRPQDLVIACPDSSNFDLIREAPDYLLHFKKEGMDELFAKEKAMLEGVSKYVDEGGTLIYMIYTISKKEGHATVTEFLINHQDFKLVKEEQLFPYDELDTAVYYCVMKKQTPLAKEGVPAEAIAAAKPTVSSTISAQSAK